jgi:hypothetical protein
MNPTATSTHEPTRPYPTHRPVRAARLAPTEALRH